MKDDARTAGGGSTLRAVLDAVYDASLQPEKWPAALAVLARCLRAAGAFLQIGAAGPPSATVSASAGLDLTALLAYRASDPLREPLVPAVCHKVGEVLRDGDDIKAEVLAASELARLVLEPAGLQHIIGASLACDEVFFAAVWAFRPAGAPFSDAEASALREVVPHLQRAVAIQRRIAEAEQQAATSSAALDRIALGALIVDVEARPLLVNRLAERILARRDGLFLTPAGLAGDSQAATLALREAIRDVVTSAARDGRTSSAGLRLERRAGGNPLEVIVVSLKGPRRTPVAQQSAIVFVADPEHAHIRLPGAPTTPPCARWPLPLPYTGPASPASPPQERYRRAPYSSPPRRAYWRPLTSRSKVAVLFAGGTRGLGEEFSQARRLLGQFARRWR
ncbi:MAG TPA: hypothetical protein P5234_03470 [Thermoanaerobaculaceae bacterium]|nr:hypothetical protein [Thermoanaerobaculaceae bacterium]HRS15291.1 hypothetical protein [Thermoanaerobaculaceae bacterium]